jgi:hypothetical protein
LSVKKSSQLPKLKANFAFYSECMASGDSVREARYQMGSQESHLLGFNDGDDWCLWYPTVKKTCSKAHPWNLWWCPKAVEWPLKLPLLVGCFEYKQARCFVLSDVIPLSLAQSPSRRYLLKTCKWRAGHTLYNANPLLQDLLSMFQGTAIIF